MAILLNHSGVSANCVRKKGSAPDITAKSNPNRYPPNAEIKEMPIM
jgi:hypothetical protein